MLLINAYGATVLAILMGLLPIMWSSGTGSDVMKRIAAPMVGGIVTSFILSLLIYPAVYVLWKWWSELRHIHASGNNNRALERI
jgi:Cu(I)/Ag(I) efflux system membrane protein CusA/SilA